MSLVTGLDTCIPGERGGCMSLARSLGGALILNPWSEDDLRLSKSPSSGVVLGCTVPGGKSEGSMSAYQVPNVEKKITRIMRHTRGV